MLASTSPGNWEEGKVTALSRCFLPLSPKSHKGSSGRIGVLGGSAQYTGAPYYAGMAALQAGADLSYIFCAQEAALAIKSYSPELMVAPVYSASKFDAAVEEAGDSTTKELLVDEMVKQVVSRLDRLHVLVLGPGLGRCPLVFRATSLIIQEAIARNLAMVVDADALFMLTLRDYKDLFSDYANVVLTPNVVEYKRLQENNALSVFNEGGIIVKKGENDVIIQGGAEVMACHERGGWKRSGGLGDILAGTLASFIGWQEIFKEKDQPVDRALATWSACCVTKRATCHAFREKRRAMTAPDVLSKIGPTMMEMEEETENNDAYK